MNRGAFELWRQDDNGNRFLVAHFETHTDATQRLAELTRCQHKQDYWIVAVTTDGQKKGN